jgi:phosphate transport system permease protein
MAYLNKIEFIGWLRGKAKNPFSLIAYILVLLSAIITVGFFLLIIGHILINGLTKITPSLFEAIYNSENVSVVPAVITTVYITLIALITAAPVAVFCGIYLVEYAKKGNKFVGFIRVAAETLAGIPSIIFGLFGMLFFVTVLNLKYSVISGGLTLAIMVLPLIIRATEEALKAVPDTYREASYGLGANKLRTIFKIILPAAGSGILAGVILSIGRIVGETAALIYTAGTVAKIPDGFLSSGRTLAVHMYVLASEGLKVDKAYATAVILIFVVIIINMAASFLGKAIGGQRTKNL